MDENEDTGLDFQSFYFLYRCILATKQFSAQKYGSLVFQESKDLISNHEVFRMMKRYIQKSDIIKIDYKEEKKSTYES